MLLATLPGLLDWQTVICCPHFLTGAVRVSPEGSFLQFKEKRSGAVGCPLDEEELVCFKSLPERRGRV